MRTRAIVAALLLPISGLRAQSDSLAATQAEAPASTAAAGDGSLSRVMDGFLNLYAADNAAWRADVKIGNYAPAETPPDGYQIGKSESGLSYYFRPKTWDLLTLDERRIVLRDPRFAQYLATMRKVADGHVPPLDPVIAAAAKAPVIPSEPVALGRSELMSRLLAGRNPLPDTIYFDVSASELVLPGRLLVTTNVSDTP